MNATWKSNANFRPTANLNPLPTRKQYALTLWYKVGPNYYQHATEKRWGLDSLDAAKTWAKELGLWDALWLAKPHEIRHSRPPFIMRCDDNPGHV